MKDAKINQTPKGGYMAKGIHEKCGTAMSTIMSKVNAEAAIASGEYHAKNMRSIKCCRLIELVLKINGIANFRTSL